jgi:large subunit ribosomal protein L30
VSAPTISIKQVRSANRANAKQRDTLRSLRLGRIGRQATVSDSPQTRGMLRVVEHLIEVDEGAGG